MWSSPRSEECGVETTAKIHFYQILTHFYEEAVRVYVIILKKKKKGIKSRSCNITIHFALVPYRRPHSS